MERITISIETRHYKAATKYTDYVGCPLYQALKELLPEKFIEVGGFTVCITDEPVSEEKKQGQIVSTHSVSANWFWIDVDLVDRNIKAAKEGEEIESTKVILTPLGIN